MSLLVEYKTKIRWGLGWAIKWFFEYSFGCLNPEHN